jgi:hypothetical protein
MDKTSFPLFRKRSLGTPPPAGQLKSRGQAYVELALVLPVLIIMILGLVEITFYVARYLDILDLTREAARFASVRDPFTVNAIANADCSNADPTHFHFYYYTACIFSPPATSTNCTDIRFCNGLNSYFVFDHATDDVVITVFTVTDHIVSNSWPQPDGNSTNGVEGLGYWAYSDNDSDAAHNSNWKKDCSGNTVLTQPYYTAARINTEGISTSTNNKGFVGVELYYCYRQVLGIGLFTVFVPDPLRIHVYTLMPIPAAQPTATPIP